MKLGLLLPGLLCIAPLAAQITLSPSQGPKGQPITATVSVPGAVSYHWSFGPGAVPQIISGQGTSQLIFTPQGIGALDVYCDVVTTSSSMRLKSVAAIELPPHSGGLLSLCGASAAQPGDQMGYVPRFHSGSGTVIIKNQQGQVLQSFPVSHGIPFWVSAPTTSGTSNTIYLEIKGPGGIVGPALVNTITVTNGAGAIVQPGAVTSGTVANTVRLSPWKHLPSNVYGSDYRWDSIVGGGFTSTTPHEAKFMVNAAPGGEVIVTASYYRPKTVSNPAGRVSSTTKPPIRVIAAPDATIQCAESTVNVDARNVTAEVPVHPFFPNPSDPYGYPKRLYYSWSLSGGVLKNNRGRSVTFDVTAKQGETVTLRCIVTNDAGTSAIGEKVFTLE